MHASAHLGSVNGAKPTLIKMKPDINQPFPDDISRAIRRAYYACVSFQDAQIGRVLSAVDALPAAQQPVVALVGDHGWHLGGKIVMLSRFVAVRLANPKKYHYCRVLDVP